MPVLPCQKHNWFSHSLTLNKLGLKQILILHNRQSLSAYIDLCSCQFDGLKLPWLSVHETDIYANRYQTNSVCCAWLICLYMICIYSFDFEYRNWALWTGRKITKILQILILLNPSEFYWVRNHDWVPSITRSTGTLNHVLKFCCAMVNC